MHNYIIKTYKVNYKRISLLKITHKGRYVEVQRLPIKENRGLSVISANASAGDFLLLSKMPEDVPMTFKHWFPCDKITSTKGIFLSSGFHENKGWWRLLSLMGSKTSLRSLIFCICVVIQSEYYGICFL